jgi:hypothetical protein
MIFINNKYTSIYYKIIENAKSRNLLTRKEAILVLGYVESHHIIPKSLGGDNSKNNLIFLSGREHFMCHWLLVKMTSGAPYEKMVFAFKLILKCQTRHQTRYSNKLTSRLYQKYKTVDSKIKSKNYKGKVINKTKYKFCHYDGRTELCSILEMSVKHNIPRCSLGHLVTKPIGKHHHAKGWSINFPLKSNKRSELYQGSGGPKYDSKIYSFVHKDGTVENCIKFNLFTKYNLKRDGIYYICSGKQKSSQGWALYHKLGS